jgi:hypothetical protein
MDQKGDYMNLSQIYIITTIVVLMIVALLVFFVGKKGRENKLTPLASLTFGFVLAGLLFTDNRFVGYGLMGIGVALAVIDIVRKTKSQ